MRENGGGVIVNTSSTSGLIGNFGQAEIKMIKFVETNAARCGIPAQVADQMKVLDTLHTSEVKVSIIDVRAGLLSRTLKDMTDIGFFDAVENREFKFALFHVLGPSVASLSEIEDVMPFTENGEYFVVKNHINETNFFEWDQDTYDRYFKRSRRATHEINVPKLNEMAYEQADVAGVTFKDFIDNRAADGSQGKFSFVLRGYVRKWCSEIDAEFAHVKMLQDVLSGGRQQ